MFFSYITSHLAILIFLFLFPASSQQNVEEPSSSDDENENLTSNQKVCTDHFYELKDHSTMQGSLMDTVLAIVHIF